MRYGSNLIYTSISTILLAINPFQDLPLYTPEIIEIYRPRNSPQSHAPHIFKIASAAFYKVRDEGKAQSIIISGESGAGKSESTKWILKVTRRRRHNQFFFID
jgi:myosin heavy subunit